MQSTRLIILLAACCLGSTAPITIASPAAGPQSSAKASELKKVDSKLVCMVTNKLFDKEQIPITVDKKTYYGCCEMCKERLGTDAAVREAIDPVSKKKVDKAKAVIGADAEGSVLYFENEANLKAYRG